MVNLTTSSECAKKRWKITYLNSIGVTPAELKHIRADLDELMEPAEDRLHILALDPRMQPRCLGRATTFTQNHFAIV